MTSPSPQLIIHRSANEIGGNCIELRFAGKRLLLDVGSSLDKESTRLPPSLNVEDPVEAIVISHPHQDHYGILTSLPENWPAWCGASAEVLLRMTVGICGDRIRQPIHNYSSGKTFRIGPFAITPYLIDHSAFDAYMLLVECGGRRILYSGDFRRVGRKAILVDRLIRSPPENIDVLLMEGTTLGRTESFPSESDLESQFVEQFRNCRGRVFGTWSAQNIDRTVTMYRACKRANRTLMLDLYSLDVLDRLSQQHPNLPRLGWPNLQAVITSSMKRLYETTDCLDSTFVRRCAQSGKATGARKAVSTKDSVFMLRPSLFRDFMNGGLELCTEDQWFFSMWSGYFGRQDYDVIRKAFSSVGAQVYHIHTSGHASREDLRSFSTAIAPRFLVPIHGADWDNHLEGFENLKRLRDGERFEID